MSSDTSPRLGLSFILPAQAQKHVTMNESLDRLDAIINLSLVSRSLAIQPEAPETAQAFLLPDNRSGSDWENFPPQSVVTFRNGHWEQINIGVGFICFVEDEAQLYVYDGQAWQEVTAQASISSQFGVNTQADEINRLAVKSDAILFSHDDITPGTGDLRLSLNKSESGGTASLILQTEYSLRAEIGLLGNDDLSLQVSSDGANFKQAIRVNSETGECAFPQTLLTDCKMRVFGVGASSYSPPEGVKAIKITVVGGGGGGAGAVTSTSQEFVGAGGGGAGGVCQKVISYDQLEPHYAIDVGAGGSGGSASPTAGTGARNGEAGGLSSVSSETLLLSCGGGQGAIEDKASISATAFSGGAGGVASGGDLNLLGQRGGSGLTRGDVSFQTGNGYGGNTILGLGGPFQNGNGSAATGYGSGGSGCGMIPGFVLNRSGGDGAPGIVIIEEYYG